MLTCKRKGKLNTVIHGNSAFKTLFNCFQAAHIGNLQRIAFFIAGFFDYFQPERLQILGRVEYTYLRSKSSEEIRDTFTKIAEKDVPAIIITRGQEVLPEIVEAAKTNKVPVLRTDENSSKFHLKSAIQKTFFLFAISFR